MEDWRLKPARDLNLPLSEGLRSLERENGLFANALQIASWTAIRGYLAVWHRFEVVGREHLPSQPPFVLACNHSSHLDALSLAGALPWRLRDRVFPIAAGDVFFETPFKSAFSVFMLNALPMWRKQCGSHALHQLRQRLVSDACIYILFPEGTRSRDGTMGHFKSGLGMLVAGTDVPVVPCHLRGAFEALRPAQRIPRPSKVRLSVGPALTFADTPNEKAGWAHIGERTEQAVRALANGANDDAG